jgi:hypothetical protein
MKVIVSSKNSAALLLEFFHFLNPLFEKNQLFQIDFSQICCRISGTSLPF